MVDFGPHGSGNRFVCPNDRQLSLRAKLKTGWSVKTASFGFRSSAPTPIGEDEQATIIEVIQRAEQLETMEQERVGKLVERLENMRRNALGRTPSQCLLCGDRFRIWGAPKASCMDCGRFVCQKCAIDAYTIKQRSSFKEKWLCMICAETREIWKKSGAWFFKALPKYTLPGAAVSCMSGSYKKRNSRGSRRDMRRDEDSSSEDEKRWCKLKRKNSSTESTNDTLELLQEVQTSPPRFYSRHLSSTDTQTVSKELEPLKSRLSLLTLNEVKSWEDVNDDKDKLEWTSNGSDSFASRSNSELNWNEPKGDEKRSSSVCSINSAIFKNSLEERKTESGMGTMELSMTYDPINMTLHCAVYRAKNLMPMDINSLADPFCKLNILPDAKTYTRLRTKTVHKTRNPEFNENMTFYELCEDDLHKKSLHVLVLDDDKYGHDFMGEAKIPLGKLKVQNTIYLRVPLEKLRPDQKGPLPSPETSQWFDDLWSRGQILLSLCYSTKKRALLVTVIKCANLLPMDNNGFSDPFVKLYLRPDPYHKKYKTTIKWKNLNPVFNEEFAFETRPTELSTQSLQITVWDKDYGKSNDYLGGLIVGGMSSKGQRLKHWLDMIRYPDHRHECWHNLTENTID